MIDKDSEKGVRGPRFPNFSQGERRQGLGGDQSHLARTGTKQIKPIGREEEKKKSTEGEKEKTGNPNKMKFIPQAGPM